MKPELQYSILCDDVRQERNGKFMFLGAFNIIAVPKFPVAHPVFHIANRWCTGEGKFRELSRIVNQENQVVAQASEVSFTLKDIYSSHMVISQFQNVVFKEPGRYSTEVLLDGELFRRFPFNVIQVPLKNPE